MKSFINALKGNSRGSEKSVTTGPKTKEGETKAYVSKFELLGEYSYQYVNYLKPLYTDISFEDLTATVNYLHGKDYSTDQIADSFTSTCEFWKRLVRKGEANFEIDLADLETKGPFFWLRGIRLFAGDEMDFGYNEPLATIARHRIAFEKSMTNLGRPGK